MKKLAGLETLSYNFQYNLVSINYFYHYYFTIIIVIIIVISGRRSSNTPGHRFFFHIASFFTQPAQQAFPFGFGAKRDRGRGFLVFIIFTRSLTLVPRSLLLNRTEPLATQATVNLMRLRHHVHRQPSSKYEHRRTSALLRNIRNIMICMGKKPIVSVTYENERISIKNSLSYLKCVLRLSCVVHGPICGHFFGFLCKRFSDS